MFLDLDHGRTLAVNGRVRKLSEFIKNILILMMKKGLAGLEQHEGEEFMTEFSFLGELSL